VRRPPAYDQDDEPIVAQLADPNDTEFEEPDDYKRSRRRGSRRKSSKVIVVPDPLGPVLIVFGSILLLVGGGLVLFFWVIYDPTVSADPFLESHGNSSGTGLQRGADAQPHDGHGGRVRLLGLRAYLVACRPVVGEDEG
jgi:hypothetical protein